MLFYFKMVLVETFGKELCVCVSTRHCFFDICEFDEPFRFTLVEGVAAVPPFVQVDHGISLCCKYLFPSPTMYGKSSRFDSKPPIIFNIKLRKVALSNNKCQQNIFPFLSPSSPFNQLWPEKHPWQSHIYKTLTIRKTPGGLTTPTFKAPFLYALSRWSSSTRLDTLVGVKVLRWHRAVGWLSFSVDVAWALKIAGRWGWLDTASHQQMLVLKAVVLLMFCWGCGRKTGGKEKNKWGAHNKP